MDYHANLSLCYRDRRVSPPNAANGIVRFAAMNGFAIMQVHDAAAIRSHSWNALVREPEKARAHHGRPVTVNHQPGRKPMNAVKPRRDSRLRRTENTSASGGLNRLRCAF